MLFLLSSGSASKHSTLVAQGTPSPAILLPVTIFDLVPAMTKGMSPLEGYKSDHGGGSTRPAGSADVWSERRRRR
eukprot:125195-Hanusia_phi.AAC.1